jgi:hypothetical protein
MEQRRITCEDCYFRRELLCALRLDEPCPTFRPASALGLVPPRQAPLLSPVAHATHEPGQLVARAR